MNPWGSSLLKPQQILNLTLPSDFFNQLSQLTNISTPRHQFSTSLLELNATCTVIPQITVQLLLSFNTMFPHCLSPQSLSPGRVDASHFTLVTPYFPLVCFFLSFFFPQRGAKPSLSFVHRSLIISTVGLTYKIPIDTLLELNSISYQNCLLKTHLPFIF